MASAAPRPSGAEGTLDGTTGSVDRAEPGQPHHKRALLRALRHLLTVVALWYMSQQFSRERAAGLAPFDVLQKVHESLGGRSSGAEFMPWLGAATVRGKEDEETDVYILGAYSPAAERSRAWAGCTMPVSLDGYKDRGPAWAVISAGA